MNTMTFTTSAMVTVIFQCFISSSVYARLLALGSELYSRSARLYSGNEPCYSTSLAGLHVWMWTGT